MRKVLILAALAAGVFGLFVAVPAYNSLVPLNNDVDLKVSNLDIQYQRRYDLIPNLWTAVQRYALHENQTFKDVAEARARATSMQLTPEVLKNPEAMAKYEANQSAFSNALGRLLVASENYPQLKADARFAEFTASLEGTENRIKFARLQLNAATVAFNNKQQLQPMRLISAFVGMPRREYFKAEALASQAPKIQLN